MIHPRFLRLGTAVAAMVLPAVCAPHVMAKEAENTPRMAALNSSNPNYTEWSLINLNATDVASANGGSGIKVALLDGVSDCRHQDLVGRCSYNLLTGGTYKYYSNHGTHTAGIVAGSQFGIAPSATIVNYAVFDDTGFVANGQKLVNVWKSAYSAGARVSSMSFGCSQMALCFTASQVSAMADSRTPMLYVKAAGNDGANLVNESILVSTATANAALARTLLVGSVNSTGTISYFSNRPGEGCLLTSSTGTSCTESLKWKYHFLVAPGEAIYSTLPGYSYGYMSGTSMATPAVAGVAALLQQRWPSLKSAPETLARILLTTATDLGAPGIDPVYGYGLLNAAAAFKANGTITLLGSGGSSVTLTGSTTTTTAMMSKMATALKAITVYDQFGRDFPLAETDGLTVRPNVLAMRQFMGRRLLASMGQADWTADFFAEEPRSRGFAIYGSAAEAPGSVMALDRTSRMGLDMPFKGGLAQFRLTGAGDPRQDFAHDPTMRPLGYFASTSLLRGALIGNASFRLPGKSRLMVYGIATTGAMDPRFDYNPLDMRLGAQGYMPRAVLTSDRDTSRQSGFGAGYWTQADDRTVLGVNASFIQQSGGYYSLTSDLADLNRPTRMFNLGAAATRWLGDWQLSLSGELTHLRTSGGAQAFSFTPTTLASAELGLRKNNLAFAHGTLRDSLALSVAVPPRAIAGNLKVHYLKPAADDLELEQAVAAIPVSALGSEPMRVEAAYAISRGSRWSINLSGGVNLRRVPGMAAGEGMATFRLSY